MPISRGADHVEATGSQVLLRQVQLASWELLLSHQSLAPVPPPLGSLPGLRGKAEVRISPISWYLPHRPPPLLVFPLSQELMYGRDHTSAISVLSHVLIIGVTRGLLMG